MKTEAQAQKQYEAMRADKRKHWMVNGSFMDFNEPVDLQTAKLEYGKIVQKVDSYFSGEKK